jgi:hypothetical protein
MAEQRKEIFEYFDPNKAPGEGILIGATRVPIYQYQGAQLVETIKIEPVYATDANSFKIFENFEPNYRKSLAQKLKSAKYYKGPITGKATRDLREAYLNAQSDLGKENKNRLDAFGPEGQQNLDNIETFLTRQSRSDGDGRPKIRKDIRISNETEARTLINAVLQDAIGRGATKEELEKYTSALQKAQKASPTVTTYDRSGDVQTATVTPGINSEQFLIQEIAGTDEAKANKVFGYYDAFKNALGVR